MQADVMLKGLKITNYTGSIFWNSSSTAGVEYILDLESDSEYKENYKTNLSKDTKSYIEDDSSDNSSENSFNKFDRNDLAEVLENQYIDVDDLDYHGTNIANEV